MSTLIIGARGSMGTRYQAILRQLKADFECADIETKIDTVLLKAIKADRVLLCTPTETHLEYLERLIPLKIPILCEKPITKNSKEVRKIIELVKESGTQFHMVMQYAEFMHPNMAAEHSSYDYFRTGKDGLYWDCLQIIGLARGKVEVKNSSAIWKCTLNGKRIDFSLMDVAYVNFIRKWIDGLLSQDFEDLVKIHEKVERMQCERDKLFN